MLLTVLLVLVSTCPAPLSSHLQLPSTTDTRASNLTPSKYCEANIASNKQQSDVDRECTYVVLRFDIYLGYC